MSAKVPPYVCRPIKNFAKIRNFKKWSKPLKSSNSELSKYIHMLGVKKSGCLPILDVFRLESAQKLRISEFLSASKPKNVQNGQTPRFFDPQHMYIFGKLRIWTFQWFGPFFKISNFWKIFYGSADIGRYPARGVPPYHRGPMSDHPQIEYLFYISVLINSTF